MHEIEPHYNWRHLYIASEDEKSPFYGYQNSEVYFTHSIYDHIIHPQWDHFGSDTLVLKILYVHYELGFAIIELMGEWNDCLYNDIMFLKRDIIDPMVQEGIDKFILIGENVLNFHASDDCYYEEWAEDTDQGWTSMINFRTHVVQEMDQIGIDQFFISGGEFEDLSWRKMSPMQLYRLVESSVSRRLPFSL
jgi:hypothetical protein